MALTDSLISYWKLDEASGTRVDSHTGGNDLTDNNTVTQNPGKISDAAQFTRANSEWLSKTDNAGLSTGDIDFTVALWVYLDTSAATEQFVAGKWAGVGGREWLIRVQTNKFRFLVVQAADSVQKTVISTLGPSTATWYHLIATYDAAADTMSLYVNNGTADTTASVSGPPDTAGALFLGGENGAANFLNGRIDEMGFWKRVLTSQERTDLYGGGAGLVFPFATIYIDTGLATSVARTSGIDTINIIESGTPRAITVASGLDTQLMFDVGTPQGMFVGSDVTLWTANDIGNGIAVFSGLGSDIQNFIDVGKATAIFGVSVSDIISAAMLVMPTKVALINTGITSIDLLSG